MLLILRITVAAIFFSAAYAKLGLWSGAPEGMSAGMANLTKFLSIVEPLGALALLLGFLTRLASIGLAIIMVGAIFVLQFGLGMGFTTAAGAGWNFPLMVLAGCLTLIVFGPGAWAMSKKREVTTNLFNPSSSARD